MPHSVGLSCFIVNFSVPWKCKRAPRRDLGTLVARQNLVHTQDERHGDRLDSDGSDKMLVMIVFLRHLLGWVVSACRSREDLVLENLALRQQLLTLHEKTVD
jgi:hypothetical protein